MSNVCKIVVYLYPESRLSRMCIPTETKTRFAYLENRVAVVEQMLGRDRSRHVRRGGRDEGNRLRGGYVFHHHF